MRLSGLGFEKNTSYRFNRSASHGEMHKQLISKGSSALPRGSQSNPVPYSAAAISVLASPIVGISTRIGPVAGSGTDIATYLGEHSRLALCCTIVIGPDLTFRRYHFHRPVYRPDLSSLPCVFQAVIKLRTMIGAKSLKLLAIELFCPMCYLLPHPTWTICRNTGPRSNHKDPVLVEAA